MNKKDKKKLIKQCRKLDKECRELTVIQQTAYKRIIVINDEKFSIKQRLYKDLEDKLFKP